MQDFKKRWLLQHWAFNESKKEASCRKCWKKGKVQEESRKTTVIRQFCLGAVESVPRPPPPLITSEWNINYLTQDTKPLTMKPQHTFTATAPAFDPSHHAPAFAFTAPCFLTSSPWTPKCQLSCPAFADSCRHLSHLLHYIHGFFFIPLCVQLPHICKLRGQDSFFLYNPRVQHI